MQEKTKKELKYFTWSPVRLARVLHTFPHPRKTSQSKGKSTNGNECYH